MDKQYIKDNEIEIKYLRNQLTPEEVEEFEVYLMENPEMVEGLELSELLSGSKSSNIIIDSTQKDIVLGSVVSRIWSPSVLLAYSLGLVTALVISNSVWWTNKATNPIEGAFTQVAYLSPTRGGEIADDAVLVLEYPKESFAPDSNDKVVLTMDMGFVSQSEYRVIMRGPLDSDIEKVRLANFEQIKSDRLGILTVVKNLRNVRPGVYQIEVVDKARQNSHLFYVTLVSKKSRPEEGI